MRFIEIRYIRLSVEIFETMVFSTEIVFIVSFNQSVRTYVIILKTIQL